MKRPSLSCKIELFCSLNPSEDPSKVKFAIDNILSNCKITIEKFSIKASSNDLQSLEKIHENIGSMNSQRIYRRTLEKNLDANSTWFYLNKQAAFAEKIAICEKSDESPLGPIKLVLTSSSINRIIDWLIDDEE
ncbi:MAG TPA: RNA-binding domain-containing protein [Nitrosopumilaceae archaeon]|nr:RNA-binding domain-containing protein [Nitrosopumilaceae archaeon]